MDEERSRALEALAARRWRLALTLTALMLVTYFGFVLLVAYDKPLLGKLLSPGLSLGILLGACVILVAWALTGIYVRWANRTYDVELERVRGMGETSHSEQNAGPSPPSPVAPPVDPPSAGGAEGDA
jgi:uncharacterized membrane protein (DUF485 family)